MRTQEHGISEEGPPAMVPAGYMAKRVCARPGWLASNEVIDIYSVSSCFTHCFTDYVEYWRHNGFWLFDHPEIIGELSRDNSIDMTGLTFFYYKVFAKEFDPDEKCWASFGPEASFQTDIQVPEEKVLAGYDVVSFSTHSSPECSPLSCNHLAEVISVNEHCLLRTFSEAKYHLERGAFNNAEPGPYRIFAIYRLPEWDRPGL